MINAQSSKNFLSFLHTCSHLFTALHTLSTLFSQWQFLVEFSPCESCSFSILRAILLKLHIFAHLIKSYSTVSGLCSCIEKIHRSLWQPILQWPCTLSRNVIFCTFKGSYSSVLRSILLKLHILTRLIESFPTLCSLWSCIEIEMSIPLGAHT